MAPPKPVTHSGEETLFARLQKDFAGEYEASFAGRLTPKTVVVIPSLTLDQEILKAVTGHVHYEERMLCLLMLLRMPRTQVVYVTSVPVDDSIIDYYLHLLPGITGYHARQRLTLLNCYDASPVSLTQKILARPRLMERIRQCVPPGDFAHITFFNVTEAEKKLAEQLRMPVYGCDPALYYWGTKSGSRRLFRQAGIDMPPGYEDLKNRADIVTALAALKKQYPQAQKAVIKMNDGFSGEGNAVFSYSGINADDARLQETIDKRLPEMKIVAQGLALDMFLHKFETMGGIAELFVEGAVKASPSAQCRITPLGRCDVISTHDQHLGGEAGQVFLGAAFPAHPDYAVETGRQGLAVAQQLRNLGVLGRFSVDFISVKEPAGWKHYAIEINLRKGGTTHPYLMLQFLTDGDYNWQTGRYHTANGQERFYFASDNLRSNAWKGLTPHDLIDIAMCNGLLYDGSTQEGVMFHMIGALSQHGKMGAVAIGATPEKARLYYDKIVMVLDAECRPAGRNEA